MQRLFRVSSAALTITMGVLPVVSHAGWIEELCKGHMTPRVCIATIKTNLSLPVVGTPVIGPPGTNNLPGGSGGFSDMVVNHAGGSKKGGFNKHEVDKLRMLTDRSKWSMEELQLDKKISVSPPPADRIVDYPFRPGELYQPGAPTIGKTPAAVDSHRMMEQQAPDKQKGILAPNCCPGNMAPGSRQIMLGDPRDGPAR